MYVGNFLCYYIAKLISWSCLEKPIVCQIREAKEEGPEKFFEWKLIC